MSSIKDRIRNLQQSTNPQASKSVAERANAVERVAEPDTEQPKSLSQLKKKFDSNVTKDSGSGLGARVARFDSDTAQSLKDRARRLESGTSDTGSLSARASAFEHSAGAVKDVAGQFSDQEKASNEDTTTLHKARAMFETGSKDPSPVEKALSHLKISPENGSNGVNIRNDVTKKSSAKQTEPKPPPSTIASQEEKVADGVSSRAAIFERSESESKPNAKLVPPTQRNASKAQPALRNAQKDETSETDEATNADASKAIEEKSLRDELREVKRANEELVSVLLELTCAFRNLESTRDELQRRIADLEKK